MFRLSIRVAVLLALLSGLSGARAEIRTDPLALRTAYLSHPPSGLPMQAAARTLKEYLGLPLSFEPNLGQFSGPIHFIARGPGYTLSLTSGEAVVALTGAQPIPQVAQRVSRKSARRRSNPALMRMLLRGANTKAPLEGLDESPGKTNYLIGSNPTNWRTHVPVYGRVRSKGVYPGIDLVYYGNHRQLEYDFIVSPGANPADIRIGISADPRHPAIHIGTAGDLVVRLRGAEARWRRPVLYQEVNGHRRPVEGGYRVVGKDTVAFQTGAYDHSRPLVIDPIFVYSTYLGGSGSNEGLGIAVDSAGSAYVVGDTSSGNFPVTPGALQTGFGGIYDAFITKLSPDGSSLVYSTYLGGNGSDHAYGIAVDSSGSAYIAGDTSSTNFPTTPGAFQTGYGGGNADAFFARLSADGSSLLYSTYLGGSDYDTPTAVAIDSGGDAYITGITFGKGFPTTPGAFQTTIAGTTGSYDAFVAKINPTLTGASALRYSTFLGGSAGDRANGIAVDASGNAYVTGYTYSTDFPITAGAFQTTRGGTYQAGFVTCLNPTGSALVYSTYLTGTNTTLGEHVVVDSAGNAYVAGYTNSNAFPTTPGAFQTTYTGSNDAFVTKLNPTGAGLVYSTFLNGSGSSSAYGIAIDSAGDAYVTGTANSSGFPITSDAPQPVAGGDGDVFITEFNPAGSGVITSTFLGGTHSDTGLAIAIDGAGGVYVTGREASPDFPTTVGAFQTNSGFGNFVAKMGANTSNAPYISGFTPNGGSIGTSVAITGFSFSGTTAVKFNGVTANYVIASDSHLTATVPYGATTGRISVTTANGTGYSLTSFIVPKPAVTGFSPSHGSVGSYVVVSGYYFNGASSVKFGTVSANYRVDSDNQITATVPYSFVSGVISVTTPAGTGSSSSSFSVDAPTITGISPTSGPLGSTVTVSGASFTGVTAVKFGGVAASFFYGNDTTITATVPQGFVSGTVSVVTPAGTATSAASFVVPGPAITSLSPTNGSLRSMVVINGTGFTSASSVKFNSISANYYINNDNQIVAFVPDNATSGPVTVTTPSGTSSGVTFTVNPPVITGLSPNHGSIGSYVNISGSGFTLANSVQFGTLNASFFVATDTSIEAQVPPGFVNGQVTVSGPIGSGTSADSFHVDAPSITGFSPTHGVPGTNVSIQGSSFTGATSVTLNGMALSFFIANDSTITFTVPAGATSGPLSVTNPAGTGTSASSFNVP